MQKSKEPMRFDGFQYGSEVALAVGGKPGGGTVCRPVKNERDCQSKETGRKIGPDQMRCTVGIRLMHWRVFQGIPDFAPDVHTPVSRSMGQHVSQDSLSLSPISFYDQQESCQQLKCWIIHSSDALRARGNHPTFRAWLSGDQDATLDAISSLPISGIWRKLQRFRPDHIKRAARLKNDSALAALLTVGGELLQERCEILDLLLVLDAGKAHLGARDLALRVLDIIGEHLIIPGQA